MRNLLRVVSISLVLLVPAFSSAASISSSLSIGMRNAEVTMLQQALIDLGFLKVSATGYFGTLTRQAVVAFQKASGLEQVGSVGPKTRALLNAHLSGSDTTAIPIAPVVVPPVIPVTNPNPIVPVAPPAIPPTPPSTSTSQSVPSPAPQPLETDPPVITVVAPTAQLPRDTMYATMEVKTDKNAICHYGTLSQMTFESMTPFQYTGGTDHTVPLSSLGNGNLYVYYIKCQDTARNLLSAETTLSFSIKTQ